MKKALMIALSAMLSVSLMAGCADDNAVLDATPMGGPSEGAQTEADGSLPESAEAAAAAEAADAQQTLDQTGRLLNLQYKYSSAWDRTEDTEDTVAFTIHGSLGDYYAVLTVSHLDFSASEDPEAAKVNWATNAVNFHESPATIGYSLGSPSYYYYSDQDGVELIGLAFFNGDDFYELECHGPSGDAAGVMGTWTQVIDEAELV